jgi:hypothetical protein
VSGEPRGGAEASTVVFIAAYLPPTVAEAACAALPAFISRFDRFAGRIVPNASNGVLAVVCGYARAELVVAHTGVALADVKFADVVVSTPRWAPSWCRSSANAWAEMLHTGGDLS